MARGVVLIVDVDSVRLLVISDALRAEGYNALLATNYLTLEPLHGLQVDVIVLALDLPDIDGIAASHRLHAHPATAHVPCILMAPLDRLQDLPPEIPIVAALPTPVDVVRLEATVAHAMRQYDWTP